MKKNPMKTVMINGVPYAMRADMKLPYWKKQAHLNDPFKAGAVGYLTTAAKCEAKRAREGDDPMAYRNGRELYLALDIGQIELELPLAA